MRLAVLVVAAACLSACGGGGGGGGSSPPPPPTFRVGGTVTGLTGAGLILQLNGGGNLGVTSNSFAFGGLGNGASYTITVIAQPSNPTQTCAVANGTGTIAAADVNNVAISCTTNSFTVGGKLNALHGAGMVLQNNGGDNLTVNAGGSAFTFNTAVLSGGGYAVTILTQPAGQTCRVNRGTGTVGAGNVTSVEIACGFTIASLNDPLAIQQWHLKNTGQNAFADGVGVAGIDVNVDPASGLGPFGLGYTGAGVTVAVVDSGLEIAHEDLAANVVPGGSWNFINGTTDPTNTVDVDGDHGTSVSGLIAMAMDNAKGGIGVAPRASLKGFNFLSSPTQSLSQLIASLGGSTSAPNSADAFIFNQSFGIDTNTPTLIIPQEEAQYLSGVTTLRGGKGALYVKAAGNGFGTVGNVTCPNPGLSCENSNFDPANTIPYQIVAGAVNADGVRASYSTAGSALWVSAPGGEFGRNAAVAGSGAGTVLVEPAMVTTDQSGCNKGFATNTINNGSSFDNGGAPNTLCNYTNGMNGTSSATPVTAGVIALILEANPALTWRDVKHILASTARQIDAARAAMDLVLSNGTYVAEPAWTNNHATPTPFHYHNWYGFGMVDASAAVNMAKTYTLGQLGTFTDTGFIAGATLNLPIPDNSVTGASNTLSVPANPVHFVEAVQIRVNITHTFDGDLGIELVSPTGTRSVLKNPFDGYGGAENFTNQVFLSNAFYGENPVGIWTIKVVDGIAGMTGTLANWSIRVYGH